MALLGVQDDEFDDSPFLAVAAQNEVGWTHMGEQRSFLDLDGGW